MGKKVKCPHCQVPFPVQGDAGASSPGAHAGAAGEGDDNSQWHVQTEDNQKYGPVSRAELSDWVKEGRLDDRCQVLRDDWDQWKWADEVFPELKAGTSAAPAPATAATPTPPAPAAPTPNPTSTTTTTPSPAAVPHPPAAAPTVPSVSTAPTSQPTPPVAPAVPTIDLGGSSIHAGGPVVGESAPAFSLQADAGASAAGNPYQAPTSPSAVGSKATSESKRFYARTAPWLLFLSIMAFVGTGLMGLNVVLNISRAINLKMSAFFFLAVSFSASGFFYCFMPGWLMIKYYSAINIYLREDTPRSLDQMLHSCHAFWQYKGILTIVTVSITILIIILSLSGIDWLSWFLRSRF